MESSSAPFLLLSKGVTGKTKKTSARVVKKMNWKARDWANGRQMSECKCISMCDICFIFGRNCLPLKMCCLRSNEHQHQFVSGDGNHLLNQPMRTWNQCHPIEVVQNDHKSNRNAMKWSNCKCNSTWKSETCLHNFALILVLVRVLLTEIR